MINLEWLRTFRAVYKTKSLSRASELINISQPTISQHISTLESHIGQKLFTRKSKGVIETDEGRMLNNMLSGAMTTLEDIEHKITSKTSLLKDTITIGISEHLYKTFLCQLFFDLGDYVHITFGSKDTLIKHVEEGRLLYAIIPEENNTFDLICDPVLNQYLVLVATKDIDLNNIQELINSDPTSANLLLSKHIWYAHDTNSNYIKVFWSATFNKMRPSIVPNYVVPSEFEILQQLSRGSGLSIALKQTAQIFEQQGLLNIIDVEPVYFRPLSLISNKSRSKEHIRQKILQMLKTRDI